MTAKLYSNPLTPSTVTASSAANGYPATNVMGTEVLVPWRSTGTGLSSIVLDLGSSPALGALGVTECNFAGATIYADNSNPPTTNRGTLTTGTDDNGRVKGSIELAAINARYVKVEIAAGTPTDGAAFWRIGFATVFGTVTAFDRDPVYPMRMPITAPMVRAEVANKRSVQASIGSSFMAPEPAFVLTSSMRVEGLFRLAQFQLCWLNLGVSGELDLQWPVQANADTVTRTKDRYNRETVTLPFKEVA